MVSNSDKSNVTRRTNKRIQDLVGASTSTCVAGSERGAVARSPSINTTNRIRQIRKQAKVSPVKIDRQRSLYRSMRGTLRTKINQQMSLTRVTSDAREMSITPPSPSAEKTIMKKQTDYAMPVSEETTNTINNLIVSMMPHRKMREELVQLRTEQYNIHRAITAMMRVANAGVEEVKVASELLVCNKRIGAYEDELLCYSSNGGEPLSTFMVESLSIENVRVPLVWKDYLKNQGDHRRFSVFLVVQIGAFIEKSEMSVPIDRTHADFIFKKPIYFAKAPLDQEIQFQFYSHLMHRDISIASTSQKIIHHLTALSGTVGRRVSRRLSGFNERSLDKTLGPKFTLFGTSTLTSMSTKANAMKSYSLNSTEDKDGLPIFSSFCCKITRGRTQQYSSS